MAKQTINVKPHNERLCGYLSHPYEALPEYVDEIVTSSDLVNGVAIKKAEIQKVKLADRNKGLNWYDFSIDSLAAAGLLESTFSQFDGDRLAIADSFDAASMPFNNNVNNNE